MPKIVILYYSRTGNTEKMAKAVVEGAKKIKDVDVEIHLDFQSTPEIIANADAIIIGVPTYHHDITRSMKGLFEGVAVKKFNLKDKIGAAFGSYGWSGEAPLLILEIMENRFEMKVLRPPLLIKYTPDEMALVKCRQLGNDVAEELSRP